MKTLALALLALAGPAAANPMLEKCLPVAPKECGLSETSTPEQFIACFEAPVKKPSKRKAAAGVKGIAQTREVLFDESKDGFALLSCREELAHARVHKACAADIETLCAGVQPGNDRLMSCLDDAFAKASVGCQKSFVDYKAARKNVEAASKRRKNRKAVAAVRC